MAECRAMLRRGLVAGFVATVAVAASALADAPAGRRFESRELGIAFTVPAGFEVGSFAPPDLPPEVVAAMEDVPFVGAVVLVDPEQRRGRSLDAIPVGEVPAIWLERPRGPGRAGVMRGLLRDEYRREIGGRDVYWLPGFPGPYGDQSFFVLVPTADGTLLEVSAHRYLFRDRPGPDDEYPPSGYDEVIEAVLETLELLPDDP